MFRWNKILISAVAVMLVGPGAPAYERQLNSYTIRDAVFLGKSSTDKPIHFLRDYVRTFPLPDSGLHVERIEITTPFKQIVDRTRRSLDAYNPIQAEEDYRIEPERIRVTVRVWLTVTEPAHSPYTLPAFGPIYLRHPEFHQGVEIQLWQAGWVVPRARRGNPIYFCRDLAGS